MNLECREIEIVGLLAEELLDVGGDELEFTHRLFERHIQSCGTRYLDYLLCNVNLLKVIVSDVRRIHTDG